jgi:hypothetical protein
VSVLLEYVAGVKDIFVGKGHRGDVLDAKVDSLHIVAC